MRILAAITLLAGALALVPPPQRRSGVALRAGFGGAATKKTKKFVKPGKVQCINQILAARLRHCYYHGSTPSTRRQHDGVAVWSLTDRFSQHGRIIAECTRLTGRFAHR